MEEIRLRSFLLWALGLGALSCCIYLASAIIFDDRSLWIIGAVNAALMVAFWSARRIAGAGKPAVAASIVGVSVLFAIIAVLPVFAFAWPALTLASVLVVAIVLPYLHGRALASIVMASFTVGLGTSFYGVFVQSSATLPVLAQKSLLLITKIVVMVLLLALLNQFVQRLQQTLGQIMSAYQSEQRARSKAERLADQMRRLHDVTSRLSGTLPPEEIADIVLEQGIAISGADTAALWLLEGDHLSLLRALNYPASVLADYRHVSLAESVPIVECVLERQPIWLTTRDDYAARFPESEARARRYNQEARLAVACIPLEAEDQVVGVISYAFFQDRPFDDAERAVLVTMAHHCAQALETLRLLDQERAARELARAADRRKDEFLALLGHELRNPLAPIATAIEVMKLRGAAERELPILERQVRHLVGLVDDLLDVSRVTRGKIRLDKKRVDVAAAIDDAVEMTAPLMEKHSHSLAIEAPRDQLWVDADARRLAQIIANLLTNAARYTAPGGAIRVRAALEDGLVTASVEDNGSGIDPDLIPSLFEPFAQGEQPIDRSGGGLGLGLMLVKSLTELHGGEVSAHSEGLGRGSRFTIRLPAAPVSFDEATPVWLPPLDRAIRHRVLIVDDNRDAANTLGELLQAYGCEVAVAFDGPSALELAPAFAPTVAILDIGLPVMDGYELCRRLRDLIGNAARLMSLSGYGQDEDRDKSAEAGFVAHLVKPIDATALMAALDG